MGSKEHSFASVVGVGSPSSVVPVGDVGSVDLNIVALCKHLLIFGVVLAKGKKSWTLSD